MKTKNNRVEALERQVRPDEKPEMVIFLRHGVYTRGADVITEQEYQALCQSADVFTVEVLDSGGDDDDTTMVENFGGDDEKR